MKALYPQAGGPDSIQIVASDLSRLDPDEFLNDTIIDFFMKSVLHILSFLAICLCERQIL